MAAILRRRRQQRRERHRILRDRRNPMDLFDDVETYNKFRFRRQDIYNLVDILWDALHHQDGRGAALPVVLQVCISLRYLATGTFQDAIAEMIGISQSQVSKNVTKFMNAMIGFLPRYVHPPTAAEVQENKQKFRGMARFPGVFACIDGTHIKILSPSENEDVYVNRKNYHSINVQIVCDASLIIMDCQARNPGSFHDARILRASAFFRRMEDNPVNGLVLGDSAYPIRPWLMTPIANPENASQDRYNNAHRSTRVTVERCIGVLKRRWHCLHTELRLSPDKCSRVVYCCAILHNIAMKAGVPLPPEDDQDPPQPPTNDNINNVNENERARVVAGQAVREQLVRAHFS